MRKIFLLVVAMISYVLFSCKKENITNTLSLNPRIVRIDSFLLHPTPVLDSLPIPFTTGTWWKYQRNDSATGTGPGFTICCTLISFDSSIEQLTVIGKAQYVFKVNEIKNNLITRTRFDTVSAFSLELKNLTKGTIDTDYAIYYNASFLITDKFFNFSINLPVVEGIKYGDKGFFEENIIKKDTSIIVSNRNFENCIFSYYYAWWGTPDRISHINYNLFKPTVGIVYCKYIDDNFNHYAGSNISWHIRKIIDYHIEP